MQALRAAVRRGVLDSESAGHAIVDLSELPVRRHGHVALLGSIWQLRHTISSYDAAYVALADALDVPLLTTDARLARTPGLPVEVVAPA